MRGCSPLAIQDHIAAVRYETASVGYVESQFASGLRSVTLTRMVPLCRTRHKGTYAEDPFM